MALKCLDQFKSSLILASLTLCACILLSEFLISVLRETTEPKRQIDGCINILLGVNLAVFIILGLLSILLIYAIIKKNHVLMIPWIVAALVSAFSEIVFVIYILASGHSRDVLFILIGTGVTLWIVWAIFSFYRIIRQENLAKDASNIQGYLYSAYY